MLKGVDVSSHQPANILTLIDYDFAIVKASGNPVGYSWNYRNPYMNTQLKDAWERCGRVGAYHFTYGLEDPTKEAQFFLDTIGAWNDKAVLVVDYEGSQALSRGKYWVKVFAEYLEHKTGRKPVIYASGSVIVDQGLKALGYPLWVANYYKGNQSISGYDTSGCKIYSGCEGSALWQFTENGYLKGYSGKLDLNVCYEDWNYLFGKKESEPVAPIDVAKVAAAIHADMCEDNDNGYSWSPRHGEDGKGIKRLTIDGRVYQYDRGSWDCSSSTIYAWQEALKYTAYAGKLGGATYTGNMRSVFVKSGLFEVKPVAPAPAGDLYLNEQYHVAMSQGNGKMSQFSINEHGTAYGGMVGDSTGKEAYITSYYNYPWDCVLHYNGKADVKGTTTPEIKKVNDLQKVINTGGDVYRLAKGSDHMWTTSKTERDALIKKGWRDEGIAFKAPRGGTEAIYRFSKGTDHLFTTSFSEASKIQEKGWVYEGVPFFGNAEGTPVYRLYKNVHHYTTSKNENDTLVKKSGWKSEGVAFYV